MTGLTLTLILVVLSLSAVWLSKVFRKKDIPIYFLILLTLLIVFVSMLNVLWITSLRKPTKNLETKIKLLDSIVDKQHLEIEDLKTQIYQLKQENGDIFKIFSWSARRNDLIKNIYVCNGRNLSLVTGDSLGLQTIYSVPDSFCIIHFAPNHTGTDFAIWVAKVWDVDSTMNIDRTSGTSESKTIYRYKAQNFLLLIHSDATIIDTLMKFETNTYEPMESMGVWCSFSLNDKILMIHYFGAEFWRIKFYHYDEKRKFNFPDTTIYQNNKKIGLGSQFPLVFSLDSKKYYARLAPYPPTRYWQGVLDLRSGKLDLTDRPVNELIIDSVFYRQGLSPKLKSWGGVRLSAEWSPSGQQRAILKSDTLVLGNVLQESAEEIKLLILPKVVTPVIYQRFAILWKY